MSNRSWSGLVVFVAVSIGGLLAVELHRDGGRIEAHPCYSPEGQRPEWWSEVEGLGRGYGGLFGRIYSAEGEPIPGVQVSIEDTKLGWLSNSTGEFKIDSIAAGYRILKVASLGYGTEWHELSIASERTDTLCLVLRPIWIELAEVGPAGADRAGD